MKKLSSLVMFLLRRSTSRIHSKGKNSDLHWVTGYMYQGNACKHLRITHKDAKVNYKMDTLKAILPLTLRLLRSFHENNTSIILRFFPTIIAI